MNYIGKFIKNYRGEMSLREFADKCEISHTHLDSIEKGVDPRTGKPVRVTIETLKKIAKAMGMSINDLLIQSGDVKLDEIKYKEPKNIDGMQIERDIIKVPVLGKIPAGIPFEAIEDTYTIDYEEIPKSWGKGGKEYFALKIVGDSMEPEFKDNDTVIFLKSSTCQSGQYCCVKVNGFDATFKKVKIQENGILLSPLNANNSSGYTPTFYTNDEINNLPVEIIGIAKRHIGDL